MTEEQKRYKVLKRTSYEEQMSQESKEATISTFWFGFSAAASLVVFLAASQEDVGSIARMVNAGLGLITATHGAYRLKYLIQAISKKTMLEGKIDDINTELEMSEIEEGRGMKR